MKLCFAVYRDGKLLSTPTFDQTLIKIGRLTSAHLRLDDEKVARIHAVVEVHPDGQIQLIDMGSPQGCLVNGERAQKRSLSPGDEIALGDTRIVFQPAGAAAMAPPPAQAIAEITRELPSAPAPAPMPTPTPAARPRRPRAPVAAAPGLVPAEQLLEVRQLWWEDVLDVRTLSRDRAQVVIGEDDGADFFAPGELLPARSFPIARRQGADVLLTLSRKSTGTLSYPDGTVRPLSELFADRALAPDPLFAGCKQLALPCGAVATVAYGNLGFAFRTVPRVPGFVSRWTETLDTPYLNSLALALFLFVAGVATLLLRAPTPSFEDAELLKVPERFVQFIVRRSEPASPPAPSAAPTSRADEGATSSRPKHSGKEGRAGVPGMPDTGRRAAVLALDPRDPRQIDHAGLLPFLGMGKPVGLSILGEKGGLGGDLLAAVGGLTGKEIGPSGGFGLGLRGTGPGGGGKDKTIGTGPLARRYKDAPWRHGVSRLSHRPEVDVKITATDPIIQGSLSMELIRRVVHEHHSELSYCYSQELTRAPSLRGKIVVNWTIDERGFVSQARIHSTDLGNQGMEQCLLRKVRIWKFPAPRGGGVVIVNYPFLFSANG